jgi:hypothetical protein
MAQEKSSGSRTGLWLITVALLALAAWLYFTK